MRLCRKTEMLKRKMRSRFGFGNVRPTPIGEVASLKRNAILNMKVFDSLPPEHRDIVMELGFPGLVKVIGMEKMQELVPTNVPSNEAFLELVKKEIEQVGNEVEQTY